MKPCLFVARLYRVYVQLAEGLLAADERLLPLIITRGIQPHTGSALGGAGHKNATQALMSSTTAVASAAVRRIALAASHGVDEAVSASCVALEYLCDGGLQVNSEQVGGRRVCLPGSCTLRNGAQRQGGGQRQRARQVESASAAASDRSKVAECTPAHINRTSCCHSDDVSCVLPCAIQSQSVCRDGHRWVAARQNGRWQRSRGQMLLNVGQKAGSRARAVCLPRSCALAFDGPDSSCLAGAIGGARLRSFHGCCAQNIARQGAECCQESDVSCVIPPCASRHGELCSGGIRALNGTVCLATRCGTAEAAGCKRRGILRMLAKGRRYECCAAMVRDAGAQCCYPTDTACVIERHAERHNNYE